MNERPHPRRRHAPRGFLGMLERSKTYTEETEAYKVRSITELADKYGFTRPDGFVGTDRILDYGEPILLADSYKPKERSRFSQFIMHRLLKLPLG